MKELLSQLNKLKDIKPNVDWKNSNREILFSQITRGHLEEEISKFDIFKNMLPHNMFSRALQPVLAVVLIVLIVASGGVISLNAARDTNPGDSLYIAKIISEKAQLAITFNDKGKAKLGVEFASNRALEITRVIAESEKNKEKQVEKLTKDFKKEISAVKARLVKIDSAKDNSAKENKEAAETQDDDLQVFSANLEKSDQGMEIYDSAGNLLSAEEESAAVEDSVVAGPSNLDDILTEAEKLFDEQDYSGTLNKLSEANDMMDQADVSDETAAVDTASTTVESADAGGDESPADTASSTEE
ncbi:DUF5667 domain-containing protein [Candidatus Parcubacteria bacterium]|nr:DUF5667 domain-containing protein [Candidatus Parcubacteria bacterium]